MSLPLTAFGELQTAILTPMAGWTFAYNVNADLVTSTVTGSGTVSGASGFAVLSTGAATDSSSKIETKLPLRYVPGQGAVARFTAIFSTGVAGSQQLIGIGDTSDGFFFGYNGTSFGVMRRSGGVDTWTAKEFWERFDWSEAKNAIDPQMGNVYQIQFQWLGFGEIQFYVENPDIGKLVHVHRIAYANANTATSINNPTLPIMAEVKNTTNATNMVLKTPSAMGFCEGAVDNPPPPHPLALQRTLAVTKTGVTTQSNIITLSNQSTWQSKSNRIRAQMRTLSVATDGTKSVLIKLVKNATLGGSPSYGDYNANTSPVQYDVAGTTVTGGTLVFAATMDKVDAQIFDVDRWGVFVAPGDNLTISAQSASATDITVTLNWVDLI